MPKSGERNGRLLSKFSSINIELLFGSEWYGKREN
jgi:hypothetical protein